MKHTLLTVAILSALFASCGVTATEKQGSSWEDRTLDILKEIDKKSLPDVLGLFGDLQNLTQEIIDPTANKFLGGLPLYVDDEYIAALQHELKTAKGYAFRESVEPFRLHADDGLSLNPERRDEALKNWESWLDEDQREIDRFEHKIDRLQEKADEWNDRAEHAKRVENFLYEILDDPCPSIMLILLQDYRFWYAYIDQHTQVVPLVSDIANAYEEKVKRYRERINERRNQHADQQEAYRILRIIHGVDQDPVVFERGVAPANDGSAANHPRGAKEGTLVERLRAEMRSSKSNATWNVQHLASEARATAQDIDRRLK